MRTIAVARITMPESFVRASPLAGGNERSHAGVVFLAGANSIFYGEKLLTTGNPETERDQKLFDKLGISPM